MTERQRRGGRTIGIDLGTTNSVMAVIEGDQPVIIPNREGGRITPSVVAFTLGGECLVGQLARRQAVLNAPRTLTSIKRQMGNVWTTVIDDHVYTPAQIAALIVKKLKDDAEAYLGDPVTQAVITVPAYFTDAQRQATKEAGEIAGLAVARIINEPTAAALAYGLGKTRHEQMLVWDLGGGTFDVSVLDVGEGVFEVRASSGDAALGGDDYDRCLVDFLAEAFRREYGRDLRQDRSALQRLLEAAERAKIELSTLMTTTVTLPYILADATGPLHLEMEISRGTLERLTAELTDRMRPPLAQALADARLTHDQLDQVVLVGGAARMPAVQRLVREATGRVPFQGVNPDEAVALGAAIQAGVLSGQLHDVLLLDVTPFTLGIETASGAMRRIVERNSPLPFRAQERFTTTFDNQRDVQIHVLQGENAQSAANVSLGRFRLDGLVPAPRGTPRIAVAFDIDVEGIVHVEAIDEATGQSQAMTLIAQAMPPIMPDIAYDPVGMPTDLLALRSSTRPRVEQMPPRTTGSHAVVDASLIPPPHAILRRVDAIIAQARWVLVNARPPLSFFERHATEAALARLIRRREQVPLDDVALASACDDVDRMSQHIVQWRTPTS